MRYAIVISMKQVLFGGVSVLAVVLLIIALVNYQAPKIAREDSELPPRVSLSGEFVCVPPDGEPVIECAEGIKTSDGAYYLVDFSLSSQLKPELNIGDILSGNGIVVPKEMISSDVWRKYPIVGIFSITDTAQKVNTEPIVYECDADAKMCPNGESVGRRGSLCQFALCPQHETVAQVVAGVGQTRQGLQIAVTPLDVIEDSRCPEGAQCIQAGTIKVKVRIDSGMGAAFETLELGKPITTEAESIVLVDVTPGRSLDKELHPSAYQFTIHIERRSETP